jgi:hypothetical protein
MKSIKDQCGDGSWRAILESFQRSSPAVLGSSLAQSQRPLLQIVQELSDQAVAAVSPAFGEIQQLVESAAQPLAPILEEMQEMFLPGSPIGDLIIIYDTDVPEDERSDAARRLADGAFSPGHVFHHLRWARLEPAFRTWSGERSYKTAWADLVMAELVIAVREAPIDDPMNEFYQCVRRALRSSIERELAGCTFDSGDPVAKLQAEIPTPAEILEFSEWRLDHLAALRGCRRKTRS